MQEWLWNNDDFLFSPAHTDYAVYDDQGNLAQHKAPNECWDRIANADRRHTVPDQWESQILARILLISAWSSCPIWSSRK